MFHWVLEAWCIYMRKVHLGGKAGRSSALDSLTLWSKMRVLVLLSPAKTLNWAPSPAFLSEIWTQPKLLKEADPVIEVRFLACEKCKNM